MMNATAKRLVVLAIALVLLIGLGLVGCRAFRTLAEEPPIRVKKGTIEVEALAHGADWDDEGGGRWALKSGGANANLRYYVVLKAPGANCQAPTQARTAVITYSDGEAVRVLPAATKKTNVIFTPGNATHPRPELLEYRASNDDGSKFVERLELRDNGAPTTCTFTPGQFQHLCLCGAAGNCNIQQCQ
jgi:hypothetical protein